MKHLRHQSAIKRRLVTATAALILIGITTACSGSTAPSDDDGRPPVLTALPRPLSGSEVKVRDASNDFSFKLLGTVTNAQKSANTFVSPLSASFALGMLSNGAANQTLAEINTALQLQGLSQTEINSGYKSLTDLLLSLDPSVQVRIANSIWYRNSFSFHQTFFDTTTKYFGATVRPLNFDDVTASLAIINGWVRTATNDRIQKVLDDIASDDVMFLMNAIYFKGSWRDKFDVSKTASGSFKPASGAPQPAQFMNRDAEMMYTETPTYQAVDLPYGNSAFSMTIVLPKAGQDVNTLAEGLSSTGWQTLTGALHTTRVTLSLPRLKLEYERYLTNDLKSLGMQVPFGRSADFSRMTPASVFVSFVKQNSFVEINEEGTEAAAVTTIGVRVTSAPLTVTMRVDSPYLFVIRERLTGTIMFMGRIVKMP